MSMAVREVINHSIILKSAIMLPFAHKICNNFYNTIVWRRISNLKRENNMVKLSEYLSNATIEIQDDTHSGWYVWGAVAAVFAGSALSIPFLGSFGRKWK